MRPQVSVYIATSLDQCIAREDGSIGWLDRVHREGEDYGYAAFMATVDMLLMGRATWDTVLGFGEWPYTGRRVGVMTNRVAEAQARAQNGEAFFSGALGPILDRLGAEGVRRVYLDGGRLIRQGLGEGVVDDMVISVVPVLLGRGRRLFGEQAGEQADGQGGPPESEWAVAGVKAFESGLVQLSYRRA